MKKVLIVFFLLFLANASNTASAAAKFNGIMAMTLKMPNGSADLTYYFGNDAQRMDMLMKMDKIPDPLKTTVITKAANPDQAWIVNHKTKSYSVVNLRTAAENAMLVDFDSNYKLKKLGKQTIKGYSCEHISLASTTDNLDLWVSSDLGNFSTFSILQSQNPRLSNTALSKTLSKEGIEGFPVKIVQQNENGTSTMELRQIQPKTVPPSEFSIPAGYQRITNSQKPLEKSQKAHLKSLMEKMKKFEQ